MKTKIGAGKHLQTYDSRGRYCKTNKLYIEQHGISRKEKSREKRNDKILSFCRQAENKGEYLVEEIILQIEKAIPYSIQFVNSNKYDDVSCKIREFDIITKNVIIEVKSGKARHCLTQFNEQKQYAMYKNKKYIVYAPLIAKGAYKEYNKNGIEIRTNINDLIKFIKENER